MGAAGAAEATCALWSVVGVVATLSVIAAVCVGVSSAAWAVVGAGVVTVGNAASAGAAAVAGCVGAEFSAVVPHALMLSAPITIVANSAMRSLRLHGLVMGFSPVRVVVRVWCGFVLLMTAIIALVAQQRSERCTQTMGDACAGRLA